jgi:hypothetical protein
MEPADLLRHACEALERLNITYLVTGSTATVAYGEPRFTNDIDIVIDLVSEQLAAFCAAFPRGDFYLSEDAVRAAIQAKHQFNVLHPASGLKIDFILLTDSEFDQSRRQRARRLPVLADRAVTFASPEDVIVKKMLYYREGGSEKHLRDIAGVISIQGPALDRNYIENGQAALDSATSGKRFRNGQRVHEARLLQPFIHCPSGLTTPFAQEPALFLVPSLDCRIPCPTCCRRTVLRVRSTPAGCIRLSSSGSHR